MSNLLFIEVNPCHCEPLPLVFCENIGVGSYYAIIKECERPLAVRFFLSWFVLNVKVKYQKFV